MADLGTGISIVFGTSGFTGEIMSISAPGITRGSYDNSDLSTTGARTFAPTNLIDNGTLDIEFAFDPDVQPPTGGAAETVTITFPLPDGGITAATLAGSGFITDFSFTGELEEKMTASTTLKWAGAVTWTAST